MNKKLEKEQSVHIGQVEVPFEVKWKPTRETIGIRMTPGGSLTVPAPTTATMDDVRSALNQKKSWILKQLRKREDQKPPPENREFLSGEKFLYRGRRKRLQVEKNERENLIFDGSKFHMHVRNIRKDKYRIQRGTELFTNWYVEKANKELTDRTENWISQVGVSVDRIKVFASDRYWGTQEGNNIKLNACLVRAPVRIQDYVIVHELIHLRTRLHDKTFWNRIATFLPDYEERKKWLLRHGKRIHFIMNS